MRSYNLKPLLASALVLLASGNTAYCGEPKERPLCSGCNVILVSLDTLRADTVGVYGYGKDTTPNLDRLGRKGAIFLNAYAQAPNTFPSHMSIFTSQYPWTHKQVEIGRANSLAWDTVTLPMAMKMGGYRTVWEARLDSPHLSLAKGFERGFDDFAPPGPLTTGYPDFSWLPALAWLGKNRESRFFMFLHTDRIHSPFTPEPSSLRRFPGSVPGPRIATKAELYSRYLSERLPGPPEPAWQVRRKMDFIFRRSFNVRNPEGLAELKGLYDAVVFEADRDIGALYARLEELGLAEKTLLVITADHGEEFMEHGQTMHEQLYKEELHVPLIFVFPGREMGERLVPIAQSVDIMPTILAAVGLPRPGGAEGRSLLPLIEGREPLFPERLAFAKWHGDYSARDNRYTYIWKNKCRQAGLTWAPGCTSEEFYDRAADPGELKNIFPARRDLAGKFSKRLYGLTRFVQTEYEQGWSPGIPSEARKSILDTGYW